MGFKIQKKQISSSSEESMTYISDKPYLPHWEINPVAVQPGAWLIALREQLVSCSSHWLVPCSSQGDLRLEMYSFTWGIPNWVKQHKSGTSSPRHGNNLSVHISGWVDKEDIQPWKPSHLWQNMKLKGILQSEVSHTEKDKYCRSHLYLES